MMEHEPVSNVHNFLGVLRVCAIFLSSASHPSHPSLPGWGGRAVLGRCFRGKTPS